MPDNDEPIEPIEPIIEAELLPPAEAAEPTTEPEPDDADDATKLAKAKAANSHLRRLVKVNYLEYASYVIKERAIPDINDGLKPVQRRILWSLRRMHDGKFHKVANVVGYTMQFHPHGDASIYEALVNLANKDFFIERQGNFGNVITGDEASAARYIECRLTPLAVETMFNNEITELTDSYDGRNKEPVFLPSKIPSLLMLGSEGIAPGMTTRILPHNFKELLEAQIAILKGENFILYPDFVQGGIMDVSEYEDGRGKVTVRAKIDIDGRKLIIREVPPSTTTESLIASIEKADAKNKIKIASINDFTTDKVEIEIIPARGYKPEMTLKALYAYTDCSVSICTHMLVIKDNRPLSVSVSEVLRHNTDCLVEYLRRELAIELGKLNERFHEKTLERIFIENRIYKRIEKCETNELVFAEVREGLEKFRKLLKRDVSDEDIDRLLAIPIRRISLFDMNKNKQDLEDILAEIIKVEANLKDINNFSIKYIQHLIAAYAAKHPRRTEIEQFAKVDKRDVALNNIKVSWDRKGNYIGTTVKSDNTFNCNEFDKLVCLTKTGSYKLVNIPEKLYCGKLYYFNKWSKDTVYSIVYQDKKGVYFSKRCVIDKFIVDKDYQLIPDDCKIELIITSENSIYECVVERKARQGKEPLLVDFSQVQRRAPSARGFKITDKKITAFKFRGQSEVPEVESPELEEDVPAEETAPVEAAVAAVPEPPAKPERKKRPAPPAPEPVEVVAAPLPPAKPERKKQPAPAPEPVEVVAAPKPKPPPEDGDEDVLTLSSDPDFVKKRKKAQRAEPKPDDEESKDKKPDDNDWGIVQPEFGF